MRIKALLTILLTGLAMLPACGDEHAGTSDSGQAAMPVNVIQARYQPIATSVEAPGTVQPRNRIPLASQINGFVHEMRVRAGDRVRSGQVLATLDSRDAESQKSAAQSAIDEAQAALSEAKSLHGGIPLGRNWHRGSRWSQPPKTGSNRWKQKYPRQKRRQDALKC
ncbi:MAG: biotin/lipoyl-binding protein [Acidobacteriota bacterium]